AVALDPGDSSVQRHYAFLLADLGRLPEAIVAAKKAAELDPLSNDAWADLGQYLIADGQFALAHEANRRALELLPGNSFSLNNLGTLLLLEGKASQALAKFRALEFDGFRLPGVAMAEHTLGHVTESKQALEQLIAKYGND